ncbi:MAG: energy transducer TonB [Candidatus Cryptobacteroides sp.]|nr:energy transducer TonB [Candidatus Cryptobacteroides sp.]
MKKLLLLLALVPAVCLAQPRQLSVKEFLKLQASDTTSYLVQGVVAKVRSTTSGSFYLQDPTGTLLVYGLKDPAQPGVNFGQLDIVKGDTLTVLGRFTIYGGSTLEMKDGRLVRKADGPDHHLSFYDRLERKPSFKGKEGADGLEAFKAWVQKNLKKAADGATGTVEVRFVVGRNGGIQEVQAIKGGTPAMRAEAVRVVQSAPKWKPAISDGSPVRMPYTLEVRF